MMPLKLLILLSLADNFNFYKSNYLSYKTIYHFLEDYSPSSIRAGISSLLRSGDLEKIAKNGVAYFSLSSKGFRTISREFLRPNLGLKKKWDGKWRVIVFNIAERERIKRTRLRQILNEYSFGRITNSVYISPFSVLELVLKNVPKALNSNVDFFVFEAKEAFGDKRQIANKAFSLNDISRKYNEWIKKAKNKKTKIDIAISYYDIVSRLDPALPAELLPFDWPFKKSWDIFIGLLAGARGK